MMRAKLVLLIALLCSACARTVSPSPQTRAAQNAAVPAKPGDAKRALQLIMDAGDAFAAGDFAGCEKKYLDAIAFAPTAFADAVISSARYGAARCAARSKHADAALAHLRLALEAGLSDLASLEEDPSLSVLHDEPRWLKLIQPLKERYKARATLPPPYQAIALSNLDCNHLRAMLTLSSFDKEYRSSPYRDEYLDTLGTLESYLGRYREALQRFDELPPRRFAPPGAVHIDAEYQPTDAIEHIAALAARRQVVFINEAHHVPLHRAFTLRLLKPLREQGFRYFAAETLYEDEGLNARRFPLLKRTGNYTVEPMYGELVREALRLGYHIVPYEDLSDCNYVPERPFACQNQRERGQAENLYQRIFRRDPSARLLVHAGYGHIEEKQQGDWIPMGSFFKARTKLDPLSIDQTQMSENSEQKFEDPYYRTVADGLSRPTVFVAKDGRTWVLPYRAGIYDMQVFHPRTRWQQGRPDWQALDGRRRFYPLPLDICRGSLPCAVQAFLRSEGTGAVPVDQVIVADNATPVSLLLPGEPVLIRSRNKQGETLVQFDRDQPR